MSNSHIVEAMSNPEDPSQVVDQSESSNFRAIKTHLREAVGYSGLCLEEIGVRMGFAINDARSAVSRILAESLDEDPRLSTLLALAKALSLSIEELLTGKTQREKVMASHFEQLQEFLISVEQVLEPSKEAFAELLRTIEGNDYGSLEENKNLTALISEIADRLGVAFLCPRCQQPARFRCAKSNKTKNGMFSFSHNNGKQSHGGTVKIPHLRTIKL